MYSLLDPSRFVVFITGATSGFGAAAARRYVAAGGKAHHVTRHMVGLFHGVPGARQWRQHLSTEAVKTGATGDVLRDAMKRIDGAALAAA